MDLHYEFRPPRQRSIKALTGTCVLYRAKRGAGLSPFKAFFVSLKSDKKLSDILRVSIYKVMLEGCL